MSTAAPPVDTSAPAPIGTASCGSAAETAPAAAEPAAAAAGEAPAAAPMQLPTPRCDNCNEVISGRYCSACGQRLEAPVHSLWHFTQVAVEDLTHTDSRLWRTLAALLFKPGFLTREFLSGRRASYLPPVRLYLALSVVYFLYAAANPHVIVVQTDEHEQGLPTASASRLDDPEDSSERQLPGESKEHWAERICNKADYQGPFRGFVVTTLHQVCVRSVVDNGRALSEAMLHSLPRAMFVFLPLLAGAMMLMYWRPRHYYVEHLLLFVHDHAFVFLLMLLAGLASTLLTAVISALLRAPPDLHARLVVGVKSPVFVVVTLYIPWYVFRSMRVLYGQGRWLTLGKFAVLSFFYLVSGSIMFALTLLYSAVTM